MVSRCELREFAQRLMVAGITWDDLLSSSLGLQAAEG